MEGNCEEQLEKLLAILCETVIDLELQDKATLNSIPNRKMYICPLNYMY